jgi:lysophospholipase L1-like esterase
LRRLRALASILALILAMSNTVPLSWQLSAPVSASGIEVEASTVDPIPNTYLAFGDSITHGGYSSYPYPARLEDKLDIRVADSDVVNSGKPSEGTYGGSERITGQVIEHQPKYVLILEGTNDVTRGKLPADIRENLNDMIDNARETAGVSNVQVILATIIPRGAGELELNDETQEMNELAVIPAARDKSVPICDLWQAFVSTPGWQWDLFYKWDRPDDWLHPNDKGLKLIADAFYQCLLTAYPPVQEETTPPVTWIESLPPSVECGQTITIPVSWDGSDNLNWVVDYDVQAKVNDGSWMDWLTVTEETSGIYSHGGSTYGDVLGFRVRGRDLVGNESDWSLPEDTQITDSVPPYEAHVNPLPPAQIAPFSVSWGGQDACADVVAYNVQYSPGGVDWMGWLTGTASTSSSSDPTSPLYGQTYYFRAQAQDEAGNWSAWSDPLQAYTLLAQFSLAGDVYNARHQPVAFAQVAVTPNPLWLSPQPGGFLAYLDTGGDYDLSVSRNDLYGPLPTMFDVAVDKDVSGLQFILPPQDDAVADGGFETGSLDAWQVGGSTAPTLTAVAHTGLQAARLDGTEGDSHLTQVLTPGLSLTQPTLSFLVRLDTPGLGSSLQVELANTDTLSVPMTYTLAVADVQWTHVWYDLTGMASQPLTLTLAVSGSSAVLLDEVSLGSALKGSHWTYLPVIQRQG